MSKCKFGIKLNIQNADEISLIIKHKSGQCKFVWPLNLFLANEISNQYKNYWLLIFYPLYMVKSYYLILCRYIIFTGIEKLVEYP